MYECLCGRIFVSAGDILRGGTEGHVATIFNLLGTRQTVQRGSAVGRAHPQCVKGPISLPPPRRLASSVFATVPILVGVKR